MRQIEDIWSPTLDKNCSKCGWSTRDTETLTITCNLGKKIKNTWVTAHNCKNYTDVTKIKEKINKQQLDLFINKN